MTIIETLEKIAPGYTYGFNKEGAIFVNGEKTDVMFVEVERNAPEAAVEAAAEAAKSALISGSYIKP